MPDSRKKTLRAIRFADKAAHSKYTSAAMREAYAAWARTLRGEKEVTEQVETRAQIPLSKYSLQTIDM